MKNKFTWVKSLLFLITSSAIAQTNIFGKVESNGEPLPFAKVYISQLSKGAVADEFVNYSIENVPNGTYSLTASFAGFSKKSLTIVLSGKTTEINFDLKEDNNLNEVVISGTLKPVLRIESPVPVEVYTPTFLKKNPTSQYF